MDTNDHVCFACDKKFKYESELARHLTKKISCTVSRDTTCSYCKKTFFNFGTLKRHWKICVSMKKDIENKKSEEKEAKIKGLENMVKIIKANQETLMKIDKQTNHSVNRANNILEEPTDYKCLVCNKEFEFHSEYVRHTDRKYSCNIERKYTCNICNKTMADASNLNIHIETCRCRRVIKRPKQLKTNPIVNNPTEQRYTDLVANNMTEQPEAQSDNQQDADLITNNITEQQEVQQEVKQDNQPEINLAVTDTIEEPEVNLIKSCIVPHAQPLSEETMEITIEPTVKYELSMNVHNQNDIIKALNLKFLAGYKEPRKIKLIIE